MPQSPGLPSLISSNLVVYSFQWQLGHNRNENARKSPMTYQEQDTVQRRYGKRMQTQPHFMKGSKRKATGTKLKTKGEEEQAITRLEEDGCLSDEDTKLLLETLLGSDSNAKHVYKKFGAEAVLIQISEKTFKGRHSMEPSITGNGGGDPDVEVLDEKIKNA
ncbi:uncharacterized protein EDB91DRAFT_1085207 [Suillus paluster]|uniref:uncharacterized protein n=1 Tax=Suillus paluster TaxID=48578 RepID=UPI001B877E37|nr:uncharacterized protein EDB91DRAFT_1085207 [Suillus paluster]KAG1731090.1 hypothetical protein EDB91DRAFT_1085207 [Suillus paluster]